MIELEFCKVCGSVKHVEGPCDVCYNREAEQIRAQYEWAKKVQKAGPPKKNSKSKNSGF